MLLEYAALAQQEPHRSALAREAQARRQPTTADARITASTIAEGDGQVRGDAPMQSPTSDDDVCSTLLSRPEPGSSRTVSSHASTAAEQAKAAQDMRRMLAEINQQTKAAVSAAEDKVALATTAYNWVRART